MNFNLKKHLIWDELAKILEQIDMNALVREHLESCNYKVMGYWDGNELYEEIAFASSPDAELASSSFGTTLSSHHSSNWIKLRFLLKADTSTSGTKTFSEDEEMGELVLILNENIEIIDENWIIDVESPFVVAKRGKDLNQKLLQA